MGARNIVRLLGDALIASEPFDLASGETLTITPEVSAQGDIDLTGFGDITLSATTLTLAGVLGITGATTVTGALAVTGGIRHKVTNLTSNTSLTVANGANGIITNRGAAGAVVVTLPDDATAGDWFAYVGVANQNITFQSETADTLVAGLNDAAADSLAFSTSSEKIGATALGFFDGTQWHVQAVIGTATVATA